MTDPFCAIVSPARRVRVRFTIDQGTRDTESNATMKWSLSILALAACAAAPAATATAQAATYVGAASCGLCHKSEAKGNQLGQWQKSKHSQAYTALTSATADSIAKAKGLAKPAVESPECLECHAITAPVVPDSKFSMKDGVQCESCHGPGSGYKAMSVMKVYGTSVAAGMSDFGKDAAKIKAQCVKCHNDRSPTMKAFNFEEQWAKVAHPRPKAS
jgi:hypothetical protein